MGTFPSEGSPFPVSHTTMQDLTNPANAPGSPYPRPKLRAIREKPGLILCDLSWESEDGTSRVEYYDLNVSLTGATCSDPTCGAPMIVGAIPGKVALHNCCRCLDHSPYWHPMEEGAETFSGLALRLLGQSVTPTPTKALQAVLRRRRSRRGTLRIRRLNGAPSEPI